MNDEPSDSPDSSDKELIVHAYDWVVRDAYTDDDRAAIHCWSLGRDSTPHLIRFNDFPAFCYLELPLFVRNRHYKWGKPEAELFMDMLNKTLGFENAPFKYTLEYRKKTYYYRGQRTYPMLMLMFKNLKAMRSCVYKFEHPIKTENWGFIKCNVWEDTINIVRKFLTARDTKFSGWFKVTATKVEPDMRVSNTEEEYIGQWDTVVEVPPDECRSWTTKPRVLAFDIECYSDKHRAMPDKYNSKHVAYMISAISQRYRESNTRKRYGIIIGDSNNIPPEKLTNCEIIKVDDEYAMVQAFADIVNREDPEIMTGYNIFSFDFPYLDHRVKRKLKAWPSMGRIIGEESIMTTKNWKSGAYGYQNINILQMEGRISIDLLPIVKRDYKLDRYDLNSVCKKFINKSKHDISAPEMFVIYEDMRRTLTEVMRLREIKQSDPELGNTYDFQVQLSKANDEFEEAKAATTRVLEYCIQDSELVIELLEKINVWIGLIEMSNIVGVTVVELFTRGQQIRCLSQLYDAAAKAGFVLDSRDAPGFKFTGGFVYEPIPGLYDNIICLDFASLYPSIIMAYNICYTTLVPPDFDEYVPDGDCNIIEFDQDEIEGGDDDDEEEVLQELHEKKVSVKEQLVKRHYRFKFYKKTEGLVPGIVRKLVTARRAVNALIRTIREDEIKPQEKTEDICTVLSGYIDGTLKIGDVKELADHIKKLSESNPPAPPEVITAAKRQMTLTQLSNIEAVEKKLVDLSKLTIPAKPVHVDHAKFELEVARALGLNTQDKVKEIFTKLSESRSERINKIQGYKLETMVLDKRQLALKTSSNSFFGFLGIHNGKMALMEGAMSITAKGRELIGKVREYIETKYQGVQIYGDTDCVRGHTPVLIRYYTGAIDYIQIKDLVKLGRDPTGKHEFYNVDNVDIWTEHGWSKIKYLMRKRTLKMMYRVLTHTGVVDVSEDHSLLNQYGEEIKPTQVEVGTKLLHHDLPNEQFADDDMDEDKAWVWGFFMAEGTCGSYECPSGPKSSWSISNQNHDFLNRAQEILRRIEPNNDFIIDPCMVSSNVDKLTARGSIVPLVERYNALFYTERDENIKQNISTDLGIRYKKVPYRILMATNNIKQAFLQGWYDGDGSKTEGVSRRFDIKGQIGAAGLFYISRAVGWNVSINDRSDKEEIYRLNLTRSTQRKDPDKIKRITPLGRSWVDVFDIETENHHFGAGVGRMIVHNSVMMSIPAIKEAKECDYWGNRLAQEISGIKKGEKDCDGVFWENGRPGLFPSPLGVEFEKAMRLFCIKKKKYAALLVNKNGTFKTEDILDKHDNVIGSRLVLLKKGIVLARRDNCNYLRRVYTKILDLIMSRGSLEQSLNILITAVGELLEGRVPPEELVIIRELGANYKSDSYFMKVFSERLKQSGKLVNPGDRLDFVICNDPNAKLLGDKMRLIEQYHASQTTDKPDTIDYNYYIEKVLMNPINQLFEVGFKDDIAQLQHVNFRPSNRHKTIHLDEPVKIILKMREKGFSLDQITTGIKHNLDTYYAQKNGQPPPKVTLNVVSKPTTTPVTVTSPPTIIINPISSVTPNLLVLPVNPSSMVPHILQPVAPTTIPLPTAPVVIPRLTAPVVIPRPTAPVVIPRPTAPVVIPRPTMVVRPPIATVIAGSHIPNPVGPNPVGQTIHIVPKQTVINVVKTNTVPQMTALEMLSGRSPHTSPEASPKIRAPPTLPSMVPPNIPRQVSQNMTALQMLTSKPKTLTLNIKK
jgi:DNA polymerase elongation subunit (family B)